MVPRHDLCSVFIEGTVSALFPIVFGGIFLSENGMEDKWSHSLNYLTYMRLNLSAIVHRAIVTRFTAMNDLADILYGLFACQQKSW